ncbi:MAG: class I SAM-dependent methyltransferase [Methanosarcinales archaeon]|nr:class I SAM-dependent methyltransferase [Methanosarcinales archaeon]
MSRQEHQFWETLEKQGDEVELRYARDLPDDTPEFIIRHLIQFETEVSRFCFQGLSGLVLDAGCGNGNLLVHAREQLQSRGFQAVGMDFSAMMLRRAARRRGTSPGDSFLQGCVDRLPFQDQAFDALLCSGVLTCLSSMEEAESALQEFWRVLKPGGILTVDFFNRSSHFTRLRRLAGERIEPPEYMTPEEFSTLLQGSGFRVVDQRGFDFKPFQGYLFMSRLKALDPGFVQERFTRLVETKVVPRIPRASRLGYRIYLRCQKV